jgi:hypothetical protein
VSGTPLRTVLATPGDAAAEHEHDDGYDGPALLVTSDAEYAVEALLRGHFEPVDGRYHWHGRVSGDLAGLEGRRHDAVLVTPSGQALCRVHDPDLWGRFCVAGVSRPPFAVELDLPTDH